MFNSKTKKIAVSAMLVALSIAYILVMFKVDLGYWSFTPFSHIFIMIGTFVSPYVGIFTTIGTVIGFLPTGNPLIWLRAGSHIFFVLFLIFMIKKYPLTSVKNMIIVSIPVSIVHALAEIAVVYLALEISIIDSLPALEYILYSCGIGTFLHSMIDFFAAVGVMKLLRKANVLE